MRRPCFVPALSFYRNNFVFCRVHHFLECIFCFWSSFSFTIFGGCNHNCILRLVSLVIFFLVYLFFCFIVGTYICGHRCIYLVGFIIFFRNQAKFHLVSKQTEILKYNYVIISLWGNWNPFPYVKYRYYIFCYINKFICFGFNGFAKIKSSASARVT